MTNFKWMEVSSGRAPLLLGELVSCQWACSFGVVLLAEMWCHEGPVACLLCTFPNQPSQLGRKLGMGLDFLIISISPNPEKLTSISSVNLGVCADQSASPANSARMVCSKFCCSMLWPTEVAAPTGFSKMLDVWIGCGLLKYLCLILSYCSPFAWLLHLILAVHQAMLQESFHLRTGGWSH